MKKLSLKIQIILLSVVSLVLLATISTYVAVTKSKSALVEKNNASLSSARDIKKSQLETFFKERVSDIEVLSTSNDVSELVEDMLHVHDELGVGATESFPVKNEMVIQKTKKHEEFFHAYMKSYGYFDVFVMCAKHGHVLYSGAKEPDYGANLTNGNLKESGLAEAYKKALQSGKPSFVDMKPYAPSNNEPAMFLATPVKVNGEVKAVLAFQISDAAISKIMNYRDNYGETQEDFLVGQDKLMRSDSFLRKDTHSLRASFANPSVGKVDTEVSKRALNGESANIVAQGYTGDSVVVSFSHIKIADDILWAIISRISEAEVMEDINEIRNIIIISSVVILLIIVLISIILVNSSVIKPIDKFKNTLTVIGKNHDLTIKVDENAPLELSQMAQSFNALVRTLRDLIENSKQSSSENASISHELSTTAMGVGENVEKSVTVIDEATKNVRG